MKPLVSVIIPVYNVQTYLNQCIDSVIYQTYTNIEIIIVDDGSTDNSLRICLDYQEKYKNIAVVHQENKGLSGARNRGLAEAKGEYVVFIDSDDFVADTFVETLVATVLLTGSRVATTRGYISFWEKDEEIRFDTMCNSKENTVVYDRNTYLKLMMLEKVCTGAPLKIFHRTIFEQFLFPDGYFEDLALMYKIFACQEKIPVIDMNLYAYRKRKDSIIRNNMLEKKKIIIPITEEMLSFFSAYPDDVKDAVKARAFVSLFSVFTQIDRNNRNLKKEFWRVLLKYRDFSFVRLDNNKLRFEIIASYFGMDFSYFIGRLLRLTKELLSQ